jgi:hypothetical protein
METICIECGRPEGKCSDFCGELAKRVVAAVKRFPATFGLRAFPGDVFRVSERVSYGSGGAPMLYTQRRMGISPTGDADWIDFCKGREGELRAQIVKV